MSKYLFFLRGTSWSSTALLLAALAAATHSQVLGSEAARLDGFTQADGTNSFALGLKSSAPAASGPRQVVILVSTAASETGDFRTKSLATLRATLARLSPDDRVKLIAFDLAATPLTQGFVAPNGPEMTNALSTLDQRTPLGSCDLEKAFAAAAKSFSGDSNTARAAIYIGDGSSRANVLSSDQLDHVVGDLAAEHIPVTTFGVGPRIDDQLLDILAARTGGMAVRESVRDDAETSGSMLADAVRGTVAWPKAGGANLPQGVEIYPKTLPPIRSDRDTVLLGDSKSALPKQLDIALDNGQKLSYSVPDFKSDAGNAFLARLVDRAKVDDGRTLSLMGWDSLASAKVQLEAGGRGLDELAREALKSGNMESADRLSDEALRRDPNDRNAQAVKDAIAKKVAGGGVPPLPVGVPAGPAVAAAPAPRSPVVGGDPGDLNMVGDAGVPPPEGAAAAADIANSSAMVDQLEKKVANAINNARNQVSINPDLAEQIIQQSKQDVLAATDAPPEVRDRLQRMLDVAGRDIKHRKEEFIYRQQQLIQQEMQHREMEITNNALAHDEAKVKQLLDRFDSLMAEGRHKLAEETVGLEAQNIVNRSAPDAEPMITAGVNWARFKGNFDDIMAVRVAKQKGFIDTMFQVEKSHVPFPDEPPIIYPDAETWKELTKRRKEKYGAMDLARQSPAEKKIEEALKSPTTIEFVETPLKDVVDYLKDVHKIEIQLDLPGLKDAGVDENTPVTKNIKGVSLRSALRLMLDELQLKYVIHNEVLLITSPAKAESDEFMTTKVYPVADLVLPIPQMGLSGLGGLGGGMGGGGMGGVGGQGGMGGMGGMGGGGGFGGGGGGMGGMMGGGMGGGGMGGMGGGMGGGGMGGGGGGGFFNVPREILPNQNARKLFAVEPEAVADQPVKSVAPQPENAAQPQAPRVDPIRLDLAPGADVKQAWEKYFAAHEMKRDDAQAKQLGPEELKAFQLRIVTQQKAVLETLQALKNAAADAVNRGKPDEAAKKHEEIIALIEAALRHDQAQPCMYELLTLSMKAAGRPQEEIDRAIMSAADFAQNSADLMFLGAYLMQANMERRALQIFHQVAQVEPLWPAPYVSGMQAARQLHDVAGLEWSTTGILGQAWMPEQAKIFDDAQRVADAAIKYLRDHQRNEEADHFEAAIKQALIRDCVVAVKWTGDADIDLMVKEPAGTVCSLRNQRTTSGGMLKGDVPNSGGKEQIAGHMAVYTCPKAFSGNYQVLVRRVFGKVSTGNLIVEVYTHYYSDKANKVVKTIPINDGEALVKFDLADGRRKESLHDAQVVNAAVAVVGQHEQQQVLAQQLAALNDPQQGAALGAVQQAAAASAAAQAQQLNPLAFPGAWANGLHGAVGYAPVIITLPEGTNYAATGVVSADRRYVRITCVPFFSQVSAVHTFSIDSGATASTPGVGTGGAGYSGVAGNNAAAGAGGAGGGVGGGIN